MDKNWDCCANSGECHGARKKARHEKLDERSSLECGTAEWLHECAESDSVNLDYANAIAESFCGCVLLDEEDSKKQLCAFGKGVPVYSELKRGGHKRPRICRCHSSAPYTEGACFGCTRGRNSERKASGISPVELDSWGIYIEEVYHFLHHSISTMLLMKNSGVEGDTFWHNNCCGLFEDTSNFLVLWTRVVCELQQVLLRVSQIVAEGAVAPEDNFECTTEWHPITVLFLTEVCGFDNPVLFSNSLHRDADKEQALRRKMPQRLLESDFSCCGISAFSFANLLYKTPPALIGLSLDDDNEFIKRCGTVATPFQGCFQRLRTVPVIPRIGLVIFILMFFVEINQLKAYSTPMSSAFFALPRKSTLYRFLLVRRNEIAPCFHGDNYSSFETEKSGYQRLRSLLGIMTTFLSSPGRMEAKRPPQICQGEVRLILYADLPFSSDGPDEKILLSTQWNSRSGEAIDCDALGDIHCAWQDLCRNAGGKPKASRGSAGGNVESDMDNGYLGCFASPHDSMGDGASTFRYLPCGAWRFSEGLIIQTVLITGATRMVPLLVIQVHWTGQAAEMYLSEKETPFSQRAEWECLARWIYRLLSTPTNVVLTEWRPAQVIREEESVEQFPWLLKILQGYNGDCFDGRSSGTGLFVYCPTIQYSNNHSSYQGDTHVFTRGLEAPPSKGFINPFSQSTEGGEPWILSTFCVEGESPPNYERL